MVRHLLPMSLPECYPCPCHRHEARPWAVESNRFAVRNPASLSRWARSRNNVTLILDAHVSPEDCAGRYPAVALPAVVADLEARPLDRLDQVQALSAVHLAQHDVADAH